MAPSGSVAWFASQLRTTLRTPSAWAVAGLASVTVLFARALDLFAFVPDPQRAANLGLETGTLFAVLYLASSGTILAGLRDPDDGWSHALRASRPGTARVWWGSLAARAVVALGMLGLCMVVTLVFSAYMDQALEVSARASLSALACILLAGVGGAAAGLWAGPAVGGGVAVALIAVSAWGPATWASLLGPPLPGVEATAADFVRTGALTLAAAALAQAGLRRLET